MGTRRGRGPVKVAHLLTRAVPALADRLLEEAIRRDWPQTVGADVARRSHPAALHRGTLDVSVDNSPWLQELTLRSAAICAAIRERHGSSVSDVRFVLATARGGSEDARAPARAAAETAPHGLSAEEQGLVDATAGQVADPALASSLKRLLTKDLLARGRRRPSAPMEQP